MRECRLAMRHTIRSGNSINIPKSNPKHPSPFPSRYLHPPSQQYNEQVAPARHSPAIPQNCSSRPTRKHCREQQTCPALRPQARLDLPVRLRPDRPVRFRRTCRHLAAHQAKPSRRRQGTNPRRRRPKRTPRKIPKPRRSPTGANPSPWHRSAPAPRRSRPPRRRRRRAPRCPRPARRRRYARAPCRRSRRRCRALGPPRCAPR